MEVFELAPETQGQLVKHRKTKWHRKIGEEKLERK